MALSKEEINRKLLHILSGCTIPAGILYIPLIPGASKHLPMIILGILLVSSILLEFIRFRMPAVQKVFYKFVGSMLRLEEDKKLTGATWIYASAFICTIIFREHPHISAIVLNLFILGDAVAAIVGLSIGRIKIGKKSLEGSLACFFLCLLFFFFVFPYIPLLLDTWNRKAPLLMIFCVSMSITIFELIPLKIGKKFIINDNLSVPVITGLIMLAF
jgi:dolichol kinase